MTWDGDDYQRRFDELAASGMDVHGEADVRDAVRAGDRARCRVAAPGGWPSSSLGAGARSSASTPTRRCSRPRARSRLGRGVVLADLTDFDLGRSFDVVVMAGNVPLFTPPGTHAALVAGCARHVGAAARSLPASSGPRLCARRLRRTVPRRRPRARRPLRHVGRRRVLRRVRLHGLGAPPAPRRTSGAEPPE